MKRVLLLLVVLALLVGGAAYFLSIHGVSEGAQLVPQSNVLYVTLPDVKRTIDRWPKTALAQIGAEPAVADFLSKPMQQMFTSGGAEGLDLIFRVKPGRLFFAVTDVSDKSASVVLGFQYFGSRKDLEEAMGRLRKELGKSMPNAATDVTDYNGDAVTKFGGAGPAVYSAAHGSWGFISNNEATLHQSLDRASGRDKSPSLADSASFKTVLGHLTKDPDFLWFAETKSVVDLLMDLGKKEGATADAKQFDQMRKITALGGTLMFDGENQRETSFFLYPDAPKVPTIDHAPMAFTTPDTMLFYDASVDWNTVAGDAYQGSLPPTVQAFLTATKIDLKQLPSIFGNDMGLAINWAPGVGIPTALLSLEIKDRPKAEGLINSLFTGLGAPATPTISKGAQIYGIPAVKTAFLDPSLAVADKSLFLATTTTELDRALSLKAGDPTLENSDAFKSIASTYKEPGQAFGYVDSKAVFERVYNLIRPIAIIAGTMTPSVSKMVDVNKLPDTETISRHLKPIVYVNKQVSDGMLIESSGPLTLSQAGILIGVGAGASYASGMMGAH